MWIWCHLATSQRRPYCTSMNSHSPVGLISWWWDPVDLACVLCGRRIHNDWTSRTNLHQVLIQTWHLSVETIRMIKKAFGDDSMSEAQIKLWYQHFNECWKSVESDPHSGRPAKSRTPENVERVQAAINKNRQLTVQELKYWGFHGLLFQRFWRRILGRNLWQHNLFCGSCHKSRRKFMLKLHRTWLITAKKDPYFP